MMWLLKSIYFPLQYLPLRTYLIFDFLCNVFGNVTVTNKVNWRWNFAGKLSYYRLRVQINGNAKTIKYLSSSPMHKCLIIVACRQIKATQRRGANIDRKRMRERKRINNYFASNFLSFKCRLQTNSFCWTTQNSLKIVALYFNTLEHTAPAYYYYSGYKHIIIIYMTSY